MNYVISVGFLVIVSSIFVYQVHWYFAAERVICSIKLKGEHIILPDKHIIIAAGTSSDHIISYNDNGTTYNRHIWISNPDLNKYRDCLQYFSTWKSSGDCEKHLIYPNDTIPCYFKRHDIIGLHLIVLDNS